MTALNISTGKKIWQVPLGYYKKLKEKGKITGTENFGGATATAGNIVLPSISSLLNRFIFCREHNQIQNGLLRGRNYGSRQRPFTWA